jgi:hypothetical protein
MTQNTLAPEQQSSEKTKGNGRKYGDRSSHPIYVWNGILEPKHREKIGPALWEFLWCINRTTKEPGGVGFVLGGKPVTYEEIAEEFGIPKRTARRHILRLARNGYIILIRTPHGYSIRVPNSCKFPDKPKTAILSGQKWPLSLAKNGHSGDKNGHSKKSKKFEEVVDKEVEESAAAKTAPLATPLSPLKKNETATLTPSEKETATPVLTFIAPLAKRKSIPQERTNRELDERRRLLIKQREDVLRKYPTNANGARKPVAIGL